MKTVQFLSKQITRRDVVRALEKFDEQYPNTNDYEEWLTEDKYIYALNHNGKLYPPKHLLSIASNNELTDFSGGEQTNTVFEQLGFIVLHKSDLSPKKSSNNCIYVTNTEWIHILRANGFNHNVNFWRKDKRNLNLRYGANFFFKPKGARHIVGRGKFVKMEIMSVEEAWERFGMRNGVPSYQKLLDRASDTLNIDSGSPMLNCIILDDLEFLEPSSYWELPQKLFPKTIMASKFYDDQEVTELISLFENGAQLRPITMLPEEVTEQRPHSEGSVKKVTVNVYERNPEARQACVDHYGYVCAVCDFDFVKTYGVLGEEFIHVHHKIPLAQIGEEYIVDPIKDLIPVCPNCHAMIHRKKEALAIEELINLIQQNIE